MEKSLDVFRSLGANVIEINLPEIFDISNEMAKIITAVEGNSAHRKWLNEQPKNYLKRIKNLDIKGNISKVYIDNILAN